MTKQQAITIVVDCAKKYRDNLVGRDILLVCLDKGKKISWMEITFEAGNFLHLTGLKVKDKGISAKDFFHRCLKNRISERDFEFASDGTTSMKLEILPHLVKPDLSANMVGEYNPQNMKLYTTKLAGSVKGCMGFVQSRSEKRYIPNTVLREDIRKIVKEPMRVLAVYRKQRDEVTFSEMVYEAKGVKWEEITYPKEIECVPKP